MSWYFTATIHSELNTPKAGIHFSDSTSARDLSVSRNWMEYVETSRNSGPAAYDVVRCDLVKKFNEDAFYKVWGQDYHMRRLENSFKELLSHHYLILGKTRNEKKTSVDKKRLLFETAHEQSCSIISSLLSKMVEHEKIDLEHSSTDVHGAVCEIFRLTLMWFPFFASGSSNLLCNLDSITVEGHASTTGQIMRPSQVPKSIVATLAMPNHASRGPTYLEELPDRHITPHAKISSWSRKRRSLEKKESFMPDGVGEVLLLHEDQSSEADLKYEVLEGMTSNFFAIYHDGSIRTAPDNILFGYVRHLVLDCASACGLSLDLRPINLKDGEMGLWAETFITSSSRLIHPIRQIMIPDYEGMKQDEQKSHKGLKWETFWEVENKDIGEYKWYQLLREILKRGGY